MKKETVYNTSRYELFNTFSINRKIDNKTNILKIKNSVKRFGFDPTKPLTIWIDTRGIFGTKGKWYVLDGQHRLEAIKQLGLSVYYGFYSFPNESTLSVNKLMEEVGAYLIAFNNSSKPWKLTDFVSHYSSKGLPFYSDVELFHTNNPKIPLTTCLVMKTANPKTSGNTVRLKGNSVTLGNPTFSVEVKDILDTIERICPLAKPYGYNFSQAVCRFYDRYSVHKEFSSYKKKLIKNIPNMLKTNAESQKDILLVFDKISLIPKIRMWDTVELNKKIK